ncbi:cupin domain-containing protein [Rhizorhabdus dicambivorans]|nr:cupin domain-containing protein [Rhizorhabdus dicambivorans]
MVTGRGADGRDAILQQGPIDPIAGMAGSANQTRLHWATSDPVTLPHDGTDPVAGAGMSMPAPGETLFLQLTLVPHSATPIHATPTLDYVAILSGELWLVMEDGGETRLTAGDTVVQNGTRHAWENRSAEPCTMMAVMVGAKVID